MSTVTRWATRYPAANIGIVTGRSSKLTVIDIDDPSLLDEALTRLGDTPLIARTPRGGYHLYYAFGGERTVAGRNYHGAEWIAGRAVDVRAQGGFVVIPPSVREPDGVSYCWHRGEPISNLMSGLPRLPAGVVPMADSHDTTPASRRTASLAKSCSVDPSGPDVGRRNLTLFDALKQVVVERRTRDPFESKDELLLWARTYNERFDPPLGDDEVRRTVRSVWKYQERGTVLVKGTKPVVFLHGPELALPPEALGVLAKLKRLHPPAKRAEFCLAPAATARSLGMGRDRFRRVRDVIVAGGFLERRSKGGGPNREPARFGWPRTQTGNQTEYN